MSFLRARRSEVEAALPGDEIAAEAVGVVEKDAGNQIPNTMSRKFEVTVSTADPGAN